MLEVGSISGTDYQAQRTLHDNPYFGGCMSEVKPALIPDEWRRIQSAREIITHAWVVDADGYTWEPPDRGLAAYLLSCDIFGFTHEDLDALTEAIHEVRATRADVGDTLRSLSERIEALLPPRDEKPRSVLDTPDRQWFKLDG
jgi:hypothetical protein